VHGDDVSQPITGGGAPPCIWHLEHQTLGQNWIASPNKNFVIESSIPYIYNIY
jgi:hypothetical protein